MKRSDSSDSPVEYEISEDTFLASQITDKIPN